MIAFNCPQCTKAFILPNDLAGSPTTCAACGHDFWVPEPPARRRRGGLLILAAVAAVAAGVLWWWEPRPGRADAVRGALAAELHAQSPAWRGVTWEECDPEHGAYRLSVHYTGERATYVFEAAAMQGGELSRVRVDPGETRYLAQASFQSGELESYRYQGGSEAERDELEQLARDLDGALATAIRAAAP
jgi:hypothetical protein